MRDDGTPSFLRFESGPADGSASAVVCGAHQEFFRASGKASLQASALVDVEVFVAD
jgi:hypothetical protein